MKRTAIVSDCGRFRYHLRREWSAGSTLLFVMLNPSTADADVDDNTIRRCVGFGQAEGFGAVEVVNLFAFRATDPADLRRAGYLVGPDNDFHLQMATALAAHVCVAWGAASQAAIDARVQVVMPMLRGIKGRDPDCLHITRTGYPGHPLYLAREKRLRPFDPAGIEDAMAERTRTAK
jgi:hypothetical protein